MQRVEEGYGRFTDGTAGYIRISADRVTELGASSSQKSGHAQTLGGLERKSDGNTCKLIYEYRCCGLPPALLRSQNPGTPKHLEGWSGNLMGTPRQLIHHCYTDRATELGAVDFLQLCLGLKIQARSNTWKVRAKI